MDLGFHDRDWIMNTHLPMAMASLLREVLLKRQPELISRISSTDMLVVTKEELDTIRELVGDELCQTGIDLNSEPNERGCRLEELIDAIGVDDG